MFTQSWAALPGQQAGVVQASSGAGANRCRSPLTGTALVLHDAPMMLDIAIATIIRRPAGLEPRAIVSPRSTTSPDCAVAALSSHFHTPSMIGGYEEGKVRFFASHQATGVQAGSLRN